MSKNPKVLRISSTDGVVSTTDELKTATQKCTWWHTCEVAVLPLSMSTFETQQFRLNGAVSDATSSDVPARGGAGA